MTNPQRPILPGSTVKVTDPRSIYKGYRGFVQRISGDRAAVLFEGGNWDKLITISINDLEFLHAVTILITLFKIPPIEVALDLISKKVDLFNFQIS